MHHCYIRTTLYHLLLIASWMTRNQLYQPWWFGLSYTTTSWNINKWCTLLCQTNFRPVLPLKPRRRTYLRIFCDSLEPTCRQRSTLNFERPCQLGLSWVQCPSYQASTPLRQTAQIPACTSQHGRKIRYIVGCIILLQLYYNCVTCPSLLRRLWVVHIISTRSVKFATATAAGGCAVVVLLL